MEERMRGFFLHWTAAQAEAMLLHLLPREMFRLILLTYKALLVL